MRFPFAYAVVAAAGLTLAAPVSAQTTSKTCEAPDLPKYPTIQSAIDDLTCTAVKVRIGTWSEQLTINRSMTFQGMVYREFRSHLKAPASLTGTNAIIRIVGRKVRVKMKHLTIEGPGSSPAGLVGVRVEKDASLTIRDSLFTGIREQPYGSGENFIGLHVGVPAETQITKLTVTQVRFEDYQGAGILVEGPGTTAVITTNLLTAAGPGTREAGDAAPAGIIVRDGAAAEILRNDVTDNAHPLGTGGGIRLIDARSGATVRLNNIDRNDVGVHILGTGDATLYRNAIDNGGDGIVLGGADASTVATGNTLTGNRISGATGVGVHLIRAEDTYVYSNEVAAGGGHGFQTDAASKLNLFSANRADTNDGYGIVDTSAGTGTSGTANTYRRSNYCNGNALGDSTPAGLCR